MEAGKVRWFSPDMGFGFIEPDNGGSDVFVHIDAVRRAGLVTLNPGQEIRFEVTTGGHSRRTSADNLETD